MRYAREHIRRYWAFSYRRALGISMLTFAIALAIGMTFTAVLSSFLYVNIAAEFAFWLLLIVITTIVLVSSLISAHISTVRYMDEYEHKIHSKYTGAWIVVLAIGAIAFFLPVLFFNNYIEPLVFLFSFGGVLWVFYLSVLLIFRHTYHEIAFSALALWVIFAVGMFALYSSNNLYAVGIQQSANIARFSLFLSMISLITIFGVTGMALVFNSSNAFVSEIKYLINAMESETKPRTTTRRRARAKRH